MLMLATFADPRIDFVFKRIFGAEEHKHLLVELLNALLDLTTADRIVDVALLSPKQRPAAKELKLAVVHVQCTDERGRRYTVGMQVLTVEGFDRIKRDRRWPAGE